MMVALFIASVIYTVDSSEAKEIRVGKDYQAVPPPLLQGNNLVNILEFI